ncbi:MAG: DUF1476 domain-containing protein [Holosporaceae bacterium]|jgi:hypothetical protein|nr:DUF1476 domain-containing protein [Holosporaceae bacterium]
MPMFSFDKSSYESRLLELLQDKFFKTAQRNKILAKWAAGRQGYKNESVDQYVRDLIFSYLVMPSDRKMIDKILSDFQNANILISENEVREKIKSIETRIKNKAEINKNVR